MHEKYCSIINLTYFYHFLNYSSYILHKLRLNERFLNFKQNNSSFNHTYYQYLFRHKRTHYMSEASINVHTNITTNITTVHNNKHKYLNIPLTAIILFKDSNMISKLHHHLNQRLLSSQSSLLMILLK